MSESSSESVSASSASAAKNRSTAPARKKGLFSRIALFVRQVVAELRKVHTPTRQELMTYTAVVIAFVAVVMLFVTVLDFIIGKLTLWVFGG